MSILGSAAVILAAAGAYTLGTARAWGRAGRGRVVTPAQATAALGAALAVTVAVASPLDGLAERSLVAHMAQHLLLMGVAGPLIAVSGAGSVLALALPTTWRRRFHRTQRRLAGPLRRSPWVALVAVAVIAHTAVVVGWHVPVLFTAGLRRSVVHATEHLSFVAVAALLWWAAAGAGRRPQAGGVLAVFTATLPITLLGVALVLADVAWYPAQTEGPLADALADQQAAGAVMWAGGGALALVGALGVFARWLASQERGATSVGKPARATSSAAPRPVPGPDPGGDDSLAPGAVR